MTSHQSLDWWRFGRLYRVLDVKETCMLVACEIVPFRYHIIVLANNKCLGVGIFEGHFSFILLKAAIGHRKM